MRASRRPFRVSEIRTRAVRYNVQYRFRASTGIFHGAFVFFFKILRNGKLKFRRY